jgi:hypothetical protein
MSRYTRNTVLLAKVETTYGTDSVPTNVLNAMLISKPQLKPLTAQNVPRDVLLGFLGQKEQLVGTMYQECSFDVELAGSGTVATRPAYGDLLLACAFAETVTATFRVDYTPISTAFQSATLYWYDDGALHKLLGARGDVSFKMTLGAIPVMSFTFKGLYTRVAAGANPVPTLTTFKVPQVVSPLNTLNLTFGGTHVATTAPLITGGVTYPSQGAEMAMKNALEYVPLLGSESVEITQRDPAGSCALDLTAAQEVTFMTSVEQATLQTVGLSHGTTAGNKVLLWLPSVQLINPTKQDVNGKRLLGFELNAVPTSGNDEARLALF